MKNLIILNDPSRADKDDALQFVLSKRFQENREFWTNFQDAFNPTKLDETVECFYKLDAGDNIVFESVFDDSDKFDMLFAIFNGLQKQGKKMNVYILHCNLPAVFDKYHVQEKHEKIDEVFQTVVNYHNIIQLGLTPEKDRRIVLPSIEENEREAEREQTVDRFRKKMKEFGVDLIQGVVIHMSQPILVTNCY